jgi:RNA polymerase subunit RPABC4/transcription elongation factor Spt4
MSIRCVCQNGHVLNVKDSYAGATGLCPVCKAHVRVPTRPKPDVSEDAILDIMGHYEPRSTSDSTIIDSFGDTSLSGIHKQASPYKKCDRCKREVPSESHVCPYCRTYIASLSDFISK